MEAVIKSINKYRVEKLMVCSGLTPKKEKKKRREASLVPRPKIEIGISVAKVAKVIDIAKNIKGILSKPMLFANKNTLR